MRHQDRASAVAPITDRAGKYLTFNLGAECYGVPVLKVREIIRLTDITPVPQMPDHVRGVINLRGKIIPVIDLQVKLGLDICAESDRSCIVVVQVRGAAGGNIQLGLLVGGVQEVVQISGDDIDEAPEFGFQVGSLYILGIAKLKTGVALLLDIDGALSGDSLPACVQDAVANKALPCERTVAS
jgi:purine-binding chemotaxis protein CheW